MSNNKLTFAELTNHLWSAADILRGSVDANEFRQPIMTLLFLKRLNDQFEEKAESLEKKLGNKKAAWEDPDYHAFFVPKEAYWKEIRDSFENIGEKVDSVCTILEHNNQQLEGVLTNTSYNDKKRFPDDVLLQLVTHFNKKRLRNSDLENEDIFGQSYEYLLAQFADSAGKSAGEFFTPREVVNLMIEILKPKEGMKICDPTCGSGGMLIWSRKYIEEHHQNPQNVTLHGQERNYGNYGMCKMNMILHGIENFRIEHENTITNPLLVENGKLIKYDLVIANYPFSMEWNPSIAQNDAYHRFALGSPSKSYADFAFIQHMYSILNNDGRAAIISSQGVLFRGSQEEKIRTSLVENDVIEGIIALPANLFFATGIPACILLLNKNKPKERKNKIIFIYAANDFGKGKTRDILRQEDISKILNCLKNFEYVEHYCHVADINEIKEKDFDLNVLKYVDISEPEKIIDIQQVINELKELEVNSKEAEKILNKNLKELGFTI